MKRKIFALSASGLLALSLAACSDDSSDDEAADDTVAEDTDAGDDEEEPDQFDPSVVGIDEKPIGDSGPQANGPLEVDLVYFQAIDMEQGSVSIPPASESDMHFEIDIATTEEANEIGFEEGVYMPYLEDMTVIVTNEDTGEEIDLGTMMPMVASDGPHYGNNISLEPGLYSVQVTIPSPGDKFMLHTGHDTSAVHGRFWDEPLVFEFENWQWDGQIL